MYEIIGYKRANFNIDGIIYRGWRVYFCIPIKSLLEERDEAGVETFTFFINEQKFPDFVPQLNDRYELFFNFYNGKQKIADIRKI